MKTKQILKQDIEQRIKELIKKYNYIKDESYYQLYLTLKEIFELRKSEDYDYTHEDLAREKGLNVSVATIKYVYGFEYFNERTKKLVEEEKITARAVLWILRRNKIFRETSFQNDIIDRVISGNLTISEMSHLHTDTILKKISEDKPMSDDVLIFEQTMSELRRARYKIINYTNYFNKKDHKERIINYLKGIIKELERRK